MTGPHADVQEMLTKHARPVSSYATDTVEVAPFVVLRIATVPFSLLDGMRSSRLDALVGQIVQAGRDLEDLREAAEDVLYRCIPRLPADDRELRRRVLSLRRDVHNARVIRARDSLGSSLEPYLERVGDRQALESWMTVEASLTNAREALASVFANELQRSVRPGLRQVLGNTNFSKSLRLANADVVDRIDGEQSLPRTPWPSSLERTLLLYFSRAAAKTSPLFGFMGVATVATCWDGDHATPHADAASYRHDIRISRGIVARLDHETRFEAFRGGNLSAHVNLSLRAMANGMQMALCNRDVVMVGRPWSEQHVGYFRLDARIKACLQPGQQDDWSGWIGRMRSAGVPPDQIERTLERMIDRGVLVVEPLTDAFDSAPIERLHDRWVNSSAPRLVGLSDDLTHLRDAIDHVRVSSGDRAPLISRIRTAEIHLRQQVGTPGADPLQNLLNETCWLNGVSGAVGPGMMKPMTDLGKFLGSQVVMSPAYVKLRAAFIRQFHVGGVCTDVMDFLLRAAPFVTTMTEFGSRPVPEAVERAPEGVRIPVTVFAQMTTPQAGQAPMLVVNQAFEGAAWLAARYTAGNSDHTQALTDHLSGWLHRFSQPRQPVDVLVSGHCNDLQAHSRLTQRVLCWPGEHLTRVPDQVITADSLRLRHDPLTDLIEVEDRAGRALQLYYLGTMFPLPMWGARYLLTVLAQPYALGRPAFGPEPDWRSDEITMSPRKMHGDVCLTRQSWWVSTEYMRKRWFSGSPVDWLVQARRDFDRHGIPSAVFAQRHVSREAMARKVRDPLDNSRKPFWIDVRNPFCLGLVEHLCRTGDWVSLTEMLPAPDDIWFRIGDSKHVTELHVEMAVTSTGEVMQGT